MATFALVQSSVQSSQFIIINIIISTVKMLFYQLTFIHLIDDFP